MGGGHVDTEIDDSQNAAFSTDAKKKDHWFSFPLEFTSVKTSPRFVTEVNPYDNPEEWDRMSMLELRTISQIPSGEIESMSTDAVILSCMNYYFLADMFCFDSIQAGIEKNIEHFNGLQELTKRKDGASRLLQLYKSIDLYDMAANDRFYSIRLMYLEMILAQDSMLDMLSIEERNELLLECYSKGQMIVEKFAEKYEVSSTLYLALRTLVKQGAGFEKIVDSSNGLRIFADTGLLDMNSINDETIGQIIAYIENNF